MATAQDAVERMRAHPASVRFAELAALCRQCFGEPRQTSGSHQVYRTPWAGDPRVNIQDFHGMAKPYQVRQVLAAVDRLAAEQAGWGDDAEEGS